VGIRAQAAEEAVDEGILVQQEGRVAASLVGDRRPAAGGQAGRAVRAEAVGRTHGGVRRQGRPEATDRAVLGTGERLGTIASHEVGAAGAAEQQRAAGEHGAGDVAVLCDGVGDMGIGMAGRVDHAHGQRPDAQLVAVRDAPGLVADLGPGGHRVGGPVPEGEGTAAGHVVVVEMGLEHGPEAKPAVREHALDPVDVALGIDRDGPAVGDGEVGAVPERRGLQGDDLDPGPNIRHAAVSLWCPAST
jgi:hypothetical protein